MKKEGFLYLIEPPERGDRPQSIQWFHWQLSILKSEEKHIEETAGRMDPQGLQIEGWSELGRQRETERLRARPDVSREQGGPSRIFERNPCWSCHHFKWLKPDLHLHLHSPWKYACGVGETMKCPWCHRGGFSSQNPMEEEGEVRREEGERKKKKKKTVFLTYVKKFCSRHYIWSSDLRCEESRREEDGLHAKGILKGFFSFLFFFFFTKDTTSLGSKLLGLVSGVFCLPLEVCPIGSIQIGVPEAVGVVCLVERRKKKEEEEIGPVSKYSPENVLKPHVLCHQCELRFSTSTPQTHRQGISQTSPCRSCKFRHPRGRFPEHRSTLRGPPLPQAREPPVGRRTPPSGRILLLP